MKKLSKKQKQEITQAIGDQLEKFDWCIFDRAKICSICEHMCRSGSKYCQSCGVKLEISEGEHSQIAHQELWKAFKKGLNKYDRF